MKEVMDYLKACGTFYLATIEGEQPRVRPFGAVCEFDGKLYIVTSNQKKVYDQMIKNPKIEISGMKEGTWIRIEGKVFLDDRQEAREAMLKDNQVLNRIYTVNDHKMEVLYLQDVTATIYSFEGKLKVIHF